MNYSPTRYPLALTIDRAGKPIRVVGTVDNPQWVAADVWTLLLPAIIG